MYRQKFMRKILVMISLLSCVCLLDSCGTAEGILRYFTSLPGNLYNAVAP